MIELTRNFKHGVSHVLAALALCCLCFGTAAQAQTVQAIPELKARITDLAGVLTADEKARLEQLSSSIETKRGSQIAVLLLGTTQPEPIEDFANRVFNQWKLGRKGVGDGVLLVVATSDRRVRLEIGLTLEGAIPDATSKRIIREVIAPAFKQNQYAGGIEAALQRLDERLASENLPLPTSPQIQSQGLASLDFEGLLPFLVFGVVIGSILRGGVGGLGPLMSAVGAGGLAWSSGYALLVCGGLGALVLLGAFVFSSLQSSQRIAGAGRYRGGGMGFPSSGSWGSGSSGGGFGSGGGGFSSGGGGQSSGGGASGDW